jgi:hypothetical protein
VANAGYTIDGAATSQWSHTFHIPTAEECTQGVESVTPEVVTFVNPNCEIDGSYTIPTKTGVKYYVDDEVAATAAGTYPITADTSITITAVADEGYIIADGATYQWSHVFDFPTAEECVLGTQSVTPAAVTFTAPTCSALGYYTITGTTGIKYYVDNQIVTSGKHTVQNGKTVTITAVADESYEIKAGATNQWSYTFTAPTNCDGSGSILGTSTTNPTTLPATNGDSTLANIVSLSIITIVVMLLGAIARRITVRQF